MIDSIRAFLEVADTLSFSRVAQQRGVAVSSVSRKIDALEADFAVKLFHRSSRLVTLTDAGEQFVPRARNMLAELEDAKQAMSALHADPRGLITVTVPSSFGRRHVSPAVLSFLRKYPLMEVDLHLGDEFIDLSAQRMDVAVRIGELPSSDLLATELAPLRRLVCAAPAYLKQRGQPETPLDLLAHNCLTVASAPVPSGWWCFPGVNRNAALAVHGTLRTDDTEALLQAAVAGIGVVHLASWLVSEAIAAGQLVQLFPQAPMAAVTARKAVHAVRMPGRSHTAKAQLFIAHLKSEFGAPPYWERALMAAG